MRRFDQVRGVGIELETQSRGAAAEDLPEEAPSPTLPPHRYPHRIGAAALQSLDLVVPLKIDIKTGTNWGELEVSKGPLISEEEAELAFAETA